MTPDSRRLLRPAAFPPERHREFRVGRRRLAPRATCRAPHAARPTPGTEHRMQGLGMHIFQKHNNNIAMFDEVKENQSFGSILHALISNFGF